MIEINLLPGASSRRPSRGSSFDVRAALAGLGGRMTDRYLLVTVIITVVAVIATGALYLTQQHRDAAVTARVAQATQDSAHFSAVIRDRAGAEARRDSMLRQVNIIRSIDDDRYIWPHIMDEVSRALPRFTWLTVMGIAGTPQGSTNVVAAPRDTGKAKSPAYRKAHPRLVPTEIPREPVQIRVMGQTVDIQALPRFMKDMEASPFLGNVQLDHSELATVSGKDVTQFQLTFAYTRPDSTLLRRVPLNLGNR
jgi:Tfp pilus assembly protein PilN